MSRRDRINARVDALERAGVITFHYCYALDGRKRWVLTPRGHAERVMSTAELEWFMLGAESALDARRMPLIRR